MMRADKVVFGLKLFVLVVFLLYWCLMVAITPTRAQSVPTALEQCMKDAARTQKTDKKTVCFSRKESVCILIDQANHRALKRRRKLELNALLKRFSLEMERLQKHHKAELGVCQKQRALLAAKKCPPPVWPWVIGSFSGLVAGGAIMGGVCYGLQTSAK